jgi:lipopolysaccharide/colanic/teichoic acid biosynthesis glycosyltransferase
MPEWLQRIAALTVALASAPLQFALAVLVRLDSPGSPFHVAERVGQGGRLFRVLKFRTMWIGATTAGPGITLVNDPRVTPVGRVLRRCRLDELPQLWNVVRGEMDLVGPRPEDPRYVDLSDPLHRLVFQARPGITGLAQLLHIDEAASIDPVDPDGSYRTRVLPPKLRLDAAYLSQRSARLDLWILVQTLAAVAGRGPDALTVSRRLGGAWQPPADHP